MRPDQAAAIINVSSRTIYRWVEEKRLHFVETPPGFSLVCLESLCDCSAKAHLDSENISDS
jgi:excisionase family DNA binding protein